MQHNYLLMKCLYTLLRFERYYLKLKYDVGISGKFAILQTNMRHPKDKCFQAAGGVEKRWFYYFCKS